MTSQRLVLDGTAVEAFVVQEGRHWCATCRLEPDQAVVVAASNASLADLTLTEAIDIGSFN